MTPRTGVILCPFHVEGAAAEGNISTSIRLQHGHDTVRFDLIWNTRLSDGRLNGTGYIYMFKHPAPEQPVSIYVGGVYLFSLHLNESELKEMICFTPALR